MSEPVTCDIHGMRKATFVRRHLIDGNNLGFHEGEADPADAEVADEQCAWCSECDAAMRREGGWNDASEGFAGVTLICDLCYEAARRRNMKYSPGRGGG